MTSPGDAVLAYWREHREQFRQSENQRAVLTNYVLVITAAVSGLVVQQGFKLRTLPLSVFDRHHRSLRSARRRKVLRAGPLPRVPGSCTDPRAH